MTIRRPRRATTMDRRCDSDHRHRLLIAELRATVRIQADQIETLRHELNTLKETR